VSRVLILAEDPDLAELIAIVVERAGHEPLIVHGEDVDGLPAADVVVIDVSDPERRRIVTAARAALPGVTLVLLASQDMATDESLGRVLAMPFDLDELRRAVAGADGLGTPEP
jgi:DNA-binding response OmpR family regulator